MLDAAVNEIRRRFGEDSLKRVCFLNGPFEHMAGGIDPAKRTGITKGI